MSSPQLPYPIQPYHPKSSRSRQHPITPKRHFVQAVDLREPLISQSPPSNRACVDVSRFAGRTPVRRMSALAVSRPKLARSVSVRLPPRGERTVLAHGHRRPRHRFGLRVSRGLRLWFRLLRHGRCSGLRQLGRCCGLGGRKWRHQLARRRCGRPRRRL
jgi:hypothetical protein